MGQVASHKHRHALKRLQEGAEKQARRFMRLHYQATGENRKQAYFERASEAAARSADLVAQMRQNAAEFAD
jgi:hypothetical protein